MKSFSLKKIMMIIALIIAAAFIWSIFSRFQDQWKTDTQNEKTKTVPVEVGQIQRGPIELLRTFSGNLEPNAAFVIAPKISGRVERIYVDLGDVVEQGQVVAELDNDEYVQAVALSEADLLVAKANLVESQNALEIAARELNRFDTLRSRGVASDSQFDSAKADQLSKQAGLEVSLAQLSRAEALLETARIRLGYTKIVANWTDGESSRVVAERYEDEGETVAANAPLLSIVALDPIIGVIFITEKDYASLKPGQATSLVTDAFPDIPFHGQIDRIAPVFGQATRQAKIELKIENPLHQLKPGMFIRVTVVLDRIIDAIIVPEQALTSRDDKTGVFVVNKDTQTVSWREVRTGVRENGRVSVTGQGLSGHVVTLGQQLLDDGSKISIPDEPGKSDSDISDSEVKEMSIE